MAGIGMARTGNARESLSPLDDCLTTLGETHNEFVYGAIERLVQAGEQVGFSVQDLIRMLRGGMSLESLLDLIEIRMTAAEVHADSLAA
jgi:hypothetical protein